MLFMVVYPDIYFTVFFFFKQKTAYEMRISDWSSDVCSSDLMSAAFVAHGFAPPAAAAIRATIGLKLDVAIASLLPEPERSRALHVEIGRASCRERVCQYV